MSAELIHRYVTESLRENAPGKVRKVMPYRGGFLAEERRQIEKRLFDGELLGVSTTAALELGTIVAGGNLTVTATTGDITSSGALTVPGVSSFTADGAAADITVDDGGNDFTGAVSFNGAGGLGNVCTCTIIG